MGRKGRNERLAAESSIPISYVIRKWIPDPTKFENTLPYMVKSHNAENGRG